MRASLAAVAVGVVSLAFVSLGFAGLAAAGQPAAPPAPPPGMSGAAPGGLPVAPAQAPGPRAGQSAPAFTLNAVDSGQARTLDSFAKAKGKKGGVVVFLSCKCPYVAQARAPLADLVKQYGDKVAFVGVNANQNEKADEIKADAASSFPFPM